MSKRNLLIVLTGIFILSSCSQSFLDLYPETNVTSASFYKTMTHFGILPITVCLWMR